MPTINQLIRKPRRQAKSKSKSPSSIHVLSVEVCVFG